MKKGEIRIVTKSFEGLDREYRTVEVGKDQLIKVGDPISMAVVNIVIVETDQTIAVHEATVRGNSSPATLRNR